MRSSRRGRSVRARLGVALLLAIEVTTVLWPIGTVVAATTQSGLVQTDNAGTKAPDGAIPREPVAFGSRPGAAPGGAGPTGRTLDPSVALRPTFAPTVAPKQTTNAKSLWTASTRTVANPDGTYTLSSTGGRENYQDGTGQWQPIDSTLVADSLGPFGFRETANDRSVRIGAVNTETALGQIAAGPATLTVRTLDVSATPTASSAAGPSPAPSSAALASAPIGSAAPLVPAASGPPIGPLPSGPDSSAAPAPDPSASPTAAPSASSVPSATPPLVTVPADGVIRFFAAGGSAEITAQGTDSGFEFGATLMNPAQSNIYAFAIDRGTLDVSVAPDGQTVLLSQAIRAEGTSDVLATGVITAPAVLDANNVPGLAGAVTTQIFVPGTGLIPPTGVSAAALAGLAPTEIVVVYTIDPLYLADPTRLFPVRLDPTACLGEGASGCTINGTGTNFDHFVMSGLPDSYPTGWTTVRVGKDSRSDDGGSYSTMRGLYYFGDVALPDGAVINDTNLALHISSEYGTPTGPVNVYRVTTGWGQTSTWNGWSSGAGYTTSGYAQTATIPGSGTMNFDVDAITQAWYTRRGENWSGDLGFVVRLVTESGNGEVEFDRYNDATASYRPKLTITYADARRGQVVLDVNASEVDDLAVKGVRQARRGRKPKTQ